MTTLRRPGPRGTTLLFVRGFLADYVRNPVNLVVLVLVPVVFVMVAAGSMADAAQLLGGTGPSVETAAAGWAAGFVAGVAMYFQVRSARAADRRLVLAGLRPARLVAARAGAGLTIAVLASAAAFAALAVRSGIDAPWRVTAGTVMFTAVYLAIGAVTGVLLRSPVNGTVLILLVWIVDIFFGPAVGSPDRLATRWLPTHFVTLWMVDLPSRHGGRLGDLGWALTWTFGALVVGWLVVLSTSRVIRTTRRLAAGSTWDQFRTSVRMGLRDHRRNPVLWALLVAVPVIFIWLAKVVTPDGTMTLSLTDAGRSTDFTFWLPDMHAGTMTPIAIASLATLAGMFIVLDARVPDQRVRLAGLRVGVLLSARLAGIALAVLVVVAGSLVVTAVAFDARQWPVYAGGNLLLGLTYALLGVSLGPIFGRVSGVLIAFLVPFLDVGIAQSPMLRPEPAEWARILPGYGSYRVLLDGGLTNDFDEAAALMLALGWLIALGVLAARLFRRAPAQARAGFSSGIGGG